LPNSNSLCPVKGLNAFGGGAQSNFAYGQLQQIVLDLQC